MPDAASAPAAQPSHAPHSGRRTVLTVMLAVLLAGAAISQALGAELRPDSGQLAFLVALAAVVPLLFVRASAWLRPLVLLAAVTMFGFLQWSCTRPTRAMEQILLHLGDAHPLALPLLKVGLWLAVALVFGRYYCGWLCPKGVIQEYVFQRRLALRVPARLDRALKWGKYLALGALAIAALGPGFPLWEAIGPFKVLWNLDGQRPVVLFLFAVLAASVFVERAYCRYLCPEGGLLALVALVSPWRIVVGPACNGCNACSRVCPTAAIDESPGKRAPVVVHARECIACQACLRACRCQAMAWAVPGRAPQPARLSGDCDDLIHAP